MRWCLLRLTPCELEFALQAILRARIYAFNRLLVEVNRLARHRNSVYCVQHEAMQLQSYLGTPRQSAEEGSTRCDDGDCDGGNEVSDVVGERLAEGASDDEEEEKEEEEEEEEKEEEEKEEKEEVDATTRCDHDGVITADDIIESVASSPEMSIEPDLEVLTVGAEGAVAEQPSFDWVRRAN